MGTSIYVDETKAKAYLVAAVAGFDEQLRLASKELGNLILPGQRSLHMKDERAPRKRLIVDTIVSLAALGVRAIVYDAGRGRSEREQRARCMQALVDGAASAGADRLRPRRNATELGPPDDGEADEVCRAAGASELHARDSAPGAAVGHPGCDRMVLGEGRPVAATGAPRR